MDEASVWEVGMIVNPFFQIAAGVILGHLGVKFLMRHREDDLGLFLVANPRRGYKERSRKTPRGAATSRCVARVGGECKFPVGDQYHQRMALAYVKAGRCSKTSKPTCSDVVRWVATHGSGEAKKAAQSQRSAILASASNASSRRRRTQTRRKKKSYY